MFARRLVCGALLGVLALPAPARPGETKQGGKAGTEAGPTVVLRVRSIDTVIENGKLLARLAGREELAPQIEGLIKSKIGPKGLDGIDTRRPLGLYAQINDNLGEAAGVVLVPIADEAAFLGLLENLNFKATKDKDGLYTVAKEAAPVPVYFRFAHQYAYVTALNSASVARDKLIEPARLFPRDMKADISSTVRLDQLPKAARDLAINKVEEELAKAKDKKEKGETEAQHKVRVAALDAFTRQMTAVLRDGRALAGQITIDRQKQELSLQVSLAGKPDSDLAGEIRRLGEERSEFGGLVKGPATMKGLAHVVLPAEVRQALVPLIRQGAEQAGKQKDEAARRQVEQLLRALEPTLKAGDIDLGFSMRGPSPAKLYTLVMGARLKQGDELEATIRELIKNLPQKERQKLKLDAESAGDVKIHRIDGQEGFDKKTRDAFGDNPLWVAFRPDAVFVSLGENGLAALKEALSAAPQVTPPLLLEVSVARLAQTLAKTEDQRKIVHEVFGKGDAGTVRLTLEGGPALRLRLSTRFSVFQFAAAFREQAGESSDE
jgi:hypothetical protein